MISCMVVDDEQAARQVIRRYVEMVEWLDMIGEFKDPLKAIEFLNSHEVDLIFLDINMPNMNGVQFIKSLANKPQVIFTTAYSDYALDGYENDVLDYLLKPIRFERFMKSLNKLDHQQTDTKSSRNFIMVKSGHSYHKVLLEHILYLKKDTNYIEIHQSNGKKLLIRENMNNVFEIFPESEFIRVHKSYVISKDHLKVIEAHQITMDNNDKIPLGANYRNTLMEKFPFHK